LPLGSRGIRAGWATRSLLGPAPKSAWCRCPATGMGGGGGGGDAHGPNREGHAACWLGAGSTSLYLYRWLVRPPFHERSRHGHIVRLWVGSSGLLAFALIVTPMIRELFATGRKVRLSARELNGDLPRRPSMITALFCAAECDELPLLCLLLCTVCVR
jgi:hypothetical protein